MGEYLVTWEVEIDADSPREAAVKALTMQRDPKSTATVFTIAAVDAVTEIDLAAWKPGDPCWSCGSVDTGDLYDGLVLLGAHCNGCGRDDFNDD